MGALREIKRLSEPRALVYRSQPGKGAWLVPFPHPAGVVVSNVAGSAPGQGERQAAILLPAAIKHLTTGESATVRVHPCSAGDSESLPCYHLS